MGSYEKSSSKHSSSKHSSSKHSSSHGYAGGSSSGGNGGSSSRRNKPAVTTTWIWYCSNCRTGPYNTSTDQACPSCYHWRCHDCDVQQVQMEISR
ncbi:uncharacterized protein CTRU02_207634 [Colletotrichum truncatum]|uniref:Uncharacterized protein n=1 Tax=Colletotrichum truncatum TaxID=5467 RepID=A0ACC3Z1C4_COLTU